MFIKKIKFFCVLYALSTLSPLYAPQKEVPLDTAISAEGVVANKPPKRSERHLSITYRQQVVGGHTFTYRDDWDHVVGKRSEVWSVDNVTVSKQEYGNALKEAEMAQWAAEQQYEQVLYEQKQERVDRIACLGARRLLDCTVQLIEAECKRLDDDVLKPFYHFGHNSLENEDSLSEIRDELLPRARKIVRMKIDASMAEMKNLYEQLEVVLPRLQALFYDSVESAIKKADDPRVLKNLLASLA